MGTRGCGWTTEELARRVVERLVPEESDAFALVAAPYLADPRGAERRLLRPADDPLGFDIGDALALATPVVTLVCGAVVNSLAQSAADEVTRRTGGLARRMFRRVTGRGGESAEDPPTAWTPGQLAEVRRIALARAVHLGRSNREAEEIADAIVSELVRGEASADDGTSDS
ncbi:hypothetical protein [Rhizohabitans arisaemae]|uniref:hypothetical protein n=1 Tax=Rhizohabitans arisaemae TaxID=2720610 RepID=UPI0024B20DB9|nr:hypothetical protein [Rhizohabitans arisaemae]